MGPDNNEIIHLWGGGELPEVGSRVLVHTTKWVEVTVVAHVLSISDSYDEMYRLDEADRFDELLPRLRDLNRHVVTRDGDDPRGYRALNDDELLASLRESKGHRWIEIRFDHDVVLSVGDPGTGLFSSYRRVKM